MLSGQNVTLEALNRETKDHIKKVSVAQEIMGVPVGVEWSGPHPEPGSAKERELVERLAWKRKFLEERMFKEAHERKLRALYVDPAEDGRSWQRPHADIYESDADLMIGNAVVEYDFGAREKLPTSANQK